MIVNNSRQYKTGRISGVVIYWMVANWVSAVYYRLQNSIQAKLSMILILSQKVTYLL